MSTYAIGDIQGCKDSLDRLLLTIKFNPNEDTLWLTGDVINRGPQSLETLRLLYTLRDRVTMVLGNHDLHALAVYYGDVPLHRHDTLTDLLNAPDCAPLMEWLRQQPLIHCNENFVLVHAGVCPAWTLPQAIALADEVHTALRHHPREYLMHLYGDTPAQWSEALTGVDRLRCITNYFTRLRFCTESGEMDFTHKDRPGMQPAHLFPWFVLPRRIDRPILFGHWAALNGESSHQAIALDTGCVWGRKLTAMSLETGAFISVP